MKRIIACVFGLVATVASAQLTAPDKALNALVGKPVVNEQDQKVGKVEHLIIYNGEVAGAVLSTGGGKRHDVGIPISQFRVEGGKILLPGATKDQLKALPEFQYPRQRR